ncbi:MAG: hypothetical protein R3211_04325, partial [Balneolaceae bacterium]|nr:hypothetical protein [Balneolaceae bacterium]
MSSPKSGHTVFTKSLFRAGNECLTKLYYRSRDDYAENGSHLPYMAHNAFNKQMLGLLLKRSLPTGYVVENGSYSEMNCTTEQRLEQSDVVIYNASFLIDHLFAKVPVVVKKGQQLDAYFVQTRAVRSLKPNLRNRNGVIRAKWVDYLLEIAFQMLVMERKYPDWEIRPWLVLPNRKEKCGTNNLDLKLAELKKNRKVGAVQIVEMTDYSGIWAKIPVSTYVRDIR